MSKVPYDEREEWRRRIQRNIDEFNRQATKLFDSTEKFGCVPDKDGLAVWIYIQSVQAPNIFEVLSRSVFQGLTPQYHVEGGRRWARFGYSHSKMVPFLESDFVVRFSPLEEGRAA
jgi:hypothetical protein